MARLSFRSCPLSLSGYGIHRSESFLVASAADLSIGVEIWLWRKVGADRQPISPRLDHSGAQEIDVGATVHLTLDELEPGNLALRLAVGPGSTMAARTAASSSQTPEAKDASSPLTPSRSQGVRSSVFLAAAMVLNRSRSLRAATIFGEAVSTATLMREASADLQSRSAVSKQAMVRAGGIVAIRGHRIGCSVSAVSRPRCRRVSGEAVRGGAAAGVGQTSQAAALRPGMVG